ncbi:uncharacterized protein LOC128675710 isoform X2 [Plodia interpunctella]|uniref:uncharacterized protein LOC128675710 isoform X2 n=1 Tax=Plodia interpunctella TaxID=58824 RepID=UPI0023686DB6|nr:uncharacterized protein LOC128675710 isoform X2 [Plodia interpunctella]
MLAKTTLVQVVCGGYKPLHYKRQRSGANSHEPFDRFSIGNIKKILKNAVLNDESIYEITTVNHIKSIAQVHSHPSTKKTVSSPNVVVKQVAQVDWEAIEQLPEFDQFIDMQNVEYGSEATKALKRCLRRSQRLFSISISTESVEVISTAENLPSPDQAQNDTIKTIFSLKSNRVVKGDWDEIEKFSDIDDYDVKQIIKIGRDHTTNVTDWLESSHSYIKPSVCSELQDVKTVTSIAQIHSDTATKQFSRSPKVLKYNVAQNDWDKIEKLADVDEVSIDRINPETDITKYVSYSLINTEKCSTLAISSESKQNITKLNFNEVIQDDWDKIEQFSEDDTVNNKESKDIDGTNEYSTENPRRSLRKREFKYYAECHYYPLNIKRRRS